MEAKSASSLQALLKRRPDDFIVHCSASRAKFAKLGPLRVDAFLAQVSALAQVLPEASYAVNLCDNRYHFMLAFCAVIVRQQTNLLPQNKTPSTQSDLISEYPDTYVIHDGCELAADAKAVNILDLALAETPRDDIPNIPLDFTAAITFTSGSTGQSKANKKSWHTFVTSTEINADYMLPEGDDLIWQCATVPGQHMWGLETSVLLPLLRRVCVCDARPLFPADIAKLLAGLGDRKLLVTTPVHLRAMTMSGIVFPQLDRILCATAPLSKTLAKQSEDLFAGFLMEIYGCSEVGSMAHRRTALTDVWQSFRDIAICEQGGEFIASAEHLPESIVLSDRLEKINATEFRLLGRSDDMVEIGGKRGSLQALNHILLSSPEVLDGVVIKPQDEKAINRLSAVVVLKEGADKKAIADFFRQRVDPVFIPRPLYVVDSLPREANGKLPQKNIQTLIRKLKS